jgi:prepilin-type processing-associated H-X9-DG protein
MGKRPIRNIRAFTIVELMVVVSITAVMMAVMLPALGRVRGKAKALVCASNLRQLGFAFAGYADDYDGYAMPATGDSKIYWWGKVDVNGIDHREGFVWPYLASELEENSVYECPQQRFGSYGLQGKPPGEQDSKKWITSTYGYNGYYLCPPRSGWELDVNIRNRPWQKITTVKGPDKVFAFSDTLIDLGSSGGIKNTFLLDPPELYPDAGSEWLKNQNPTTCFRHNDRTNVVFIDGHCEAMGLEGGEYTSPGAKIGSVGKENSPHYIPDWKQWPVSGRRR